MSKHLTYYDFFAGSGLTRVGLGAHWTCLAAKDDSHQKSEIYTKNFGQHLTQVLDIKALSASDLPGQADLAWASLTSQDLTCAGGESALNRKGSAAILHLLKMVRKLIHEKRPPRVLVLEVSTDFLSANKGAYFRRVGDSLKDCGYKFGSLIIDTLDFLPQSREYLFIVALRDDLIPPSHLVSPGPPMWTDRRVWEAGTQLPQYLKASWLWWDISGPVGKRSISLGNLLESDEVANWHCPSTTQELVSLMSPMHQQRVHHAEWSSSVTVGTVLRLSSIVRGVHHQHAEPDFHGVTESLRTASRRFVPQEVLVIGSDVVRSRPFSGRELARLMGLPDGYLLSLSESEARKLLCDGIVVPVVRHLASQLLEPLL